MQKIQNTEKEKLQKRQNTELSKLSFVIFQAYACVWCNATFSQKGTCHRHLYEGSCKKRPPSSFSPSPAKRNRRTDQEVKMGQLYSML